ncbi:hypothetical protein D3C85_1646880 [compost metagenome]
MPRPVEFAEINTLPPSKEKPSFMNDYSLGRTCGNRLQMRGGVPFCMQVLGMFPRIDFVKPHKYIMSHIRVRVLIDGDPGCGMWAVDNG